jgi:hypothetical protein
MALPRFRSERRDGLGWFLREHCERITDWSPDSERPSQHFALFLALDALDVDSVTLMQFADRLIGDGPAYLVAWGPDCERVHDIFDSCIVDREVIRGIKPPGCLMTTWHDREPLTEALEFFALCAIPEQAEWSCETWIALSVANQEWFEEIGDALFSFSV